jgi:aspartate-semialdehyde dehydrogenase
VFSAVEADVRARDRAALRRERRGHLDRQRLPLRARRAGFLPGVNWDHAGADRRAAQEARLEGFHQPGPNCTTVGLAMTLRPLDVAFGVRR